MSEILTLTASGNAERGINKITASITAEQLRRIRGYDCGILDNSCYDPNHTDGSHREPQYSIVWPMKILRDTGDDYSLLIEAGGMATAYGYDMYCPTDIVLTGLTKPPAGRFFYAHVYLEWDLRGNWGLGSVSFEITGSGAWSPHRTDNLITTPNGVYQMEIATIRYGWDQSDTIYGSKIGDLLRTNYTGHADSAVRARDYNTTKGSMKTAFDDLSKKIEAFSHRSATGTVRDLSSSGINISRSTMPMTRTGDMVLFDLSVTFTLGSGSNDELFAGMRLATVPAGYEAAGGGLFTGYFIEPNHGSKGGRTGAAEFSISGNEIILSSFFTTAVASPSVTTGYIEIQNGCYQAVPIE